MKAFEEEIKKNSHLTKAAVIASLLGEYLPHRVDAGDTVHVGLDIPVKTFNKIYDRFGPGPVDAVVHKALASIAEQTIRTKENV